MKSGAELALLRESCKWANLAHTLLQRYTRPGVSETEAETRASTEATYAMLDAIGPDLPRAEPVVLGCGRRLSRADRAERGDPACACRTTSSSRRATSS